HLKKALLLLERTLQPDDVEAWNHKAQLLVFLGRHSEALAALETILQREPDNELARVRAASLSSETERSIAHWRRAVAINPWMPEYHTSLARVLAHAGAW